MSTLNKRTINRAIRHTGLQVQHKRGDGYFYFTSLASGDQVGDSVMVCYYQDLPLAAWIREAESALTKPSP